MKLSNVIYGFIIFAAVTSILFITTAEIVTDYGIEGADEFTTLEQSYKQDINRLSLDDSSTISDMSEQTQLGEAGSEEKDITLISGAVSASRGITGYFTFMKNITNKAYADTNTYVHPIIKNTMLAILMVFIILVVISMLMRMRPEV